MDSRSSLAISIANIPPDVLHRIIEISLPTYLPDPISSRSAAIDFFSSTPPYSFALTCRAWRDVVLSSHSLWSSLSLSFDLPESEDCDALTRKIHRHLQRAGKAPLTIFLQLSSRYSGHYTRFDDIVRLLYAYRSTWKRIALDVDTSIISPMFLDLADLKFLEELHIGGSMKLNIAESTIPSLKRLEFEGLPSYHAMDWFAVSPNLQELSFLNVPPTHIPPWIPENHSNMVNSLEFLRTLRISRARGTTPVSQVVNSLGLAASVLSYITSRALRVLDLYLDSFDCHQAFVHFLRRSSPPLEFLSVNVHFIRHGDEEDRERLVVDAFSCVPSVRRLRYRGDLHVTACPEIVVRTLSGNLDGDLSSRILPELEVLELVDVVASIQIFVDIANARCQPLADMQTLKLVSLFRCFAKPTGELMSMEREELGNFEPGDHISQLPTSLSSLGEFISNGLQVRVDQSTPDDVVMTMI